MPFTSVYCTVHILHSSIPTTLYIYESKSHFLHEVLKIFHNFYIFVFTDLM